MPSPQTPAHGLPPEEFERRFGRPPAVVARAPGRVNLIGEHTDYNEGLVLPCAIDRDTRAWLAPREDGRCRVFTQNLQEQVQFETTALTRRGSWIDYVQGVVFAFAERGHAIGGFDLIVASEIPSESGLSSSAALCVAVATAVDAAFELGLDKRARALVAHRGESHFVGLGCGILDHFASALGRRDHALRIDCRSQVVEAVALPPLRLLLAHSGVTRALARGDYKERVAECRAAFEAARTAGLTSGAATSLRDLTIDDLPRAAAALEPRLLRRLRHVVHENRRVDACCAALAAADLETAGALLKEGQRSLRDDFEVSTPELDLLCESADALPGVFGSRLTGAGFGGCTLHLVDAEAADEVSEELAARCEGPLGRRPPILSVRPWDGASHTPPDAAGGSATGESSVGS